jgi:hypothetical protein
MTITTIAIITPGLISANLLSLRGASLHTLEHHLYLKLTETHCCSMSSLHKIKATGSMRMATLIMLQISCALLCSETKQE